MNSLIVCEGFQDRAFLSAWLEHLGRSLGMTQVRERQKQIVPADGAYVKEVGGRQITIAPASGYERLASRTTTILQGSGDKVDRVLVMADADDQASEERRKALQQSLLSGLQKQRTSPPKLLVVELWEPNLEAVIERALRQADSAAMGAVDGFLRTAPGTTKTGKEAAFTWCSAWEPDNFGDAFFGLVWKRDSLRARLEPLVASISPSLEQLLAP